MTKVQHERLGCTSPTPRRHHEAVPDNQDTETAPDSSSVVHCTVNDTEPPPSFTCLVYVGRVQPKSIVQHTLGWMHKYNQGIRVVKKTGFENRFF